MSPIDETVAYRKSTVNKGRWTCEALLRDMSPPLRGLSVPRDPEHLLQPQPYIYERLPACERITNSSRVFRHTSAKRKAMALRRISMVLLWHRCTSLALNVFRRDQTSWLDLSLRTSSCIRRMTVCPVPS